MCHRVHRGVKGWESKETRRWAPGPQGAPAMYPTQMCVNLAGSLSSCKFWLGCLYPPPSLPPPPWSIWNISTLKWTSFSPPLVVLGKQRRPRRPSTSRPVPTRAGGGKVGAGLPPVPPAPPRSPAWACASPKCVFWMRQRISCLVSALRLRRGGTESEQSQSREGQVQVAVQEGAGGGEPGSLLSPLPLPFSFLYFSLPFFFPLQPPFSFFLTSPPASPLPPQPREGDVGTIPSVWYVCVNIISSYELTRWRFSFLLTNRSLPQ